MSLLWLQFFFFFLEWEGFGFIINWDRCGQGVLPINCTNLCLLKSEVSEFSHNFLLSLQSCYLIPIIDKPSRVRGNSASLIDNIFVNNSDYVSVSGNIISDVSDHFS